MYDKVYVGQVYNSDYMYFTVWIMCIYTLDATDPGTLDATDPGTLDATDPGILEPFNCLKLCSVKLY